MELLKTVAEVRRWARERREQKQRIGFVPTMGYLHEGHLALARRARERCDAVIMSIFVNPTQFGPREDFASYPRDLERDLRLAEEVGVDAVFAPEVEEMYPPGYSTYVEVEGVTEVLCGASRPGHFRGVATVVTKLLNIVQPDEAFFGQKDYQQSVVVRRMAADLNIPVEIITVPTVREPDGLALSSRNKYLNEEERRQALCLYRALKLGEEMILSGERRAEAVRQAMVEEISRYPLARIDYVSVNDAETLKPLKEISGRVLLAVAVWIGKTRLIDNLVVEGRRGKD
ncbi:MAG: pantoate--beta-alanine ligase [Thermoanaerobacteraceae bacterium]|uniref:pantoate--beta-alanine ligase n=1 Tax=Thermanaeromonas sp. C210 TaxID=2731925 RepID=UPI00155B488C|nr:pantoate--beta-alanine ligase [Thermanaeromonas sp. C210]MBE3580300.1 pantoate--beta-alanine ligase [Thermoanaerobacteraceae bacterium]GFN22867.1 pantothenate synthetase [Thermanaeromonas sp. C210]